jgi:hypothetical protein
MHVKPRELDEILESLLVQNRVEVKMDGKRWILKWRGR